MFAGRFDFVRGLGRIAGPRTTKTPVTSTGMEKRKQNHNGATTTIAETATVAGGRLAHLDHETHDDDHGHAGHDVCMVLDDELVAEHGQVLVGRGLSAFDWGHFRNGTVPG